MLLERGADPYHKDCDALSMAKSDLTIGVLHDWEAKQKEKDPEGTRTKRQETASGGSTSFKRVASYGVLW